tara:strand:- start:296 stop:463 length:168 start_codon:yes stop_codon:yes gene_type:complete
MMSDNLPKITVIKVIENEDGSASMELDLDPKAVQLLLDIGFNQLLREHLGNTKDE